MKNFISNNLWLSKVIILLIILHILSFGDIFISDEISQEFEFVYTILDYSIKMIQLFLAIYMTWCIISYFLFYSSETERTLEFNYNGGYVSMEKLEEALDFMISIEPDPASPNLDEEFKKSREKYAEEIKLITKVIKKFGSQIKPNTLEAMQKIFYSITNSDKYRQSTLHCSVAYTMLERYWDGIGEWRY